MVTKNNELTEEEKQARREYNRQWREKNKDRVKLYQKKFWTKQTESNNNKN